LPTLFTQFFNAFISFVLFDGRIAVRANEKYYRSAKSKYFSGICWTHLWIRKTESKSYPAAVLKLIFSIVFRQIETLQKFGFAIII
jgi:hypothetical protein